MLIGGWIVEVDYIVICLGGDEELTIDVIFDCGDGIIGGEPGNGLGGGIF